MSARPGIGTAATGAGGTGASAEATPGVAGRLLVRALVAGVLFGFVLVRSEVVSWYRIQEMFRFQSFHMYGIIGSAVIVGMIGMAVVRRLGGHTPDGKAFEVECKPSTRRNTRYWLGGAVFGLGWGLLGACPGPIYALIGAGETAFVVPLASALAGTWAYGALRNRLPH